MLNVAHEQQGPGHATIMAGKGRTRTCHSPKIVTYPPRPMNPTQSSTDEAAAIPAALIERLRTARSMAALTGAGVSAESGVPTFRDAQTGMWAQFDPLELATPDAFRRNAKLIWDWYAWRRELIATAHPNAGHRALAAIEAASPGFLVITQNVDGLHQAAGSTRVVELHGNIRRVKCSRDGEIVGTWDDSSPREASVQRATATCILLSAPRPGSTPLRCSPPTRGTTARRSSRSIRIRRIFPIASILCSAVLQGSCCRHSSQPCWPTFPHRVSRTLRVSRFATPAVPLPASCRSTPSRATVATPSSPAPGRRGQGRPRVPSV
jgi:hypothetical protein